ncbi:putative DD34D transposase [Trichonephila clavipes]|nr:putative DD34D transposase [Trichonephila clavipes]
MLYVWWDFKGIVFCLELLLDNTTIHLEVYCHQLDKLNDALQQKRSELINRKGVVFHQDNARRHTSLVTRQKLLQLEWDTMPHPPYSPHLAPSKSACSEDGQFGCLRNMRSNSLKIILWDLDGGSEKASPVFEPRLCKPSMCEWSIYPAGTEMGLP